MRCKKCLGLGFLAYNQTMPYGGKFTCYICKGTGKIEEEDCIEKAKRWDETHGR